MAIIAIMAIIMAINGHRISCDGHNGNVMAIDGHLMAIRWPSDGHHDFNGHYLQS
jgi:hypothetical protein